MDWALGPTVFPPCGLPSQATPYQLTPAGCCGKVGIPGAGGWSCLHNPWSLFGFLVAITAVFVLLLSLSASLSPSLFLCLFFTLEESIVPSVGQLCTHPH